MLHHTLLVSRIMDSENENSSSSFLLSPLSFLLFPVWFACFWVIIGMTWRPPLASAGLITIFLAVVLAIEWMARWRTAKKLPRPIFPKKDYNESMDESILQQMIRSKTAKGLDQLNGTFLAEFSANAMTATVHIPFCPAFEHVPNVQVFPTDETDTHLRIASTKPFGIRVDVKRKNLSISRIHFVLIAEG